MKTLRAAFFLHLVLAVGSLAAAALLRGLWLVALAFALLGSFWAFTQGGFVRRANNNPFGPPASGPLLFVFVAAAVAGALLGTPSWLALLAVTGTLGAWDLDHFLRRLLSGGEAQVSGSLGRAHLRHLLLVEGLGFAAGLLASITRLRLPFWWEVLLAALAVIGLTQLINHLRAQAGDDTPEELP